MKDVIIEDYERQAKDYEKNRFSTHGGKLINKIQLDIVRELADPQKKKILDVACGTGRFTIDLLKSGADIIGVDASKNMLAIAKKKTKKQIFKQGNIFDLDFPDKTFDVVIGIKIIMHLSKYRNALKEMKRVTKDDGFIIFEIPNSLCIWSLLMEIRKKLFYSEKHKHKIKKPNFTYSYIKKTLFELGLEIDKEIGMYYIPETMFRRAPPFMLPFLYKLEKFFRIFPAKLSENIYLRVKKKK